MAERGVLVHEWLSRTGGSENVFDAMVGAFPEADVLCLWSDVRGRYGSRPVSETWLARSGMRRHKALALPFMLPTWRAREGDYDWALVSSHLFAHHVSFRNAPDHFRKYVYVHSPARYIWNPELDRRGAGPARAASPLLRSVDRSRAKEAHAVAANSEYVRRRVERAWRRDASVIHPPVAVRALQDVASWADRLTGEDLDIFSRLPRPFLLGASRFVPYKRLDMAVRVGESSGMAVVIAGAGPEEAALRQASRQAAVPVTVLTKPSDELLRALYEAATVYVFLAVEDFGIMPVEAMALGTPVLVNVAGGAGESVVDGVTGVHVSPDVGSRELASAVSRAAALDPADCRDRALDFDVAVFERRLRSWTSSLSAGVEGGS